MCANPCKSCLVPFHNSFAVFPPFFGSIGIKSFCCNGDTLQTGVCAAATTIVVYIVTSLSRMYSLLQYTI